MKNSRLYNSLPLAAGLLSEKLNVKVRFNGDGAFSHMHSDSGEYVINLPLFDDSENLYNEILGYLVHESAHVLYTDFKYCERVFSESASYNIKALANIHNVCEDLRIERMITEKYPGSVVFLRAVRKHVFTDKFQPSSNPAQIFIETLLFCAREKYHQFNAYSSGRRDEFLDMFGQEKFDRMLALAGEAFLANDTETSMRAAKAIYDLADFQPEDNDESNGQSSPDDSDSDDSSSDSGSNGQSSSGDPSSDSGSNGQSSSDDSSSDSGSNGQSSSGDSSSDSGSDGQSSSDDSSSDSGGNSQSSSGDSSSDDSKGQSSSGDSSSDDSKGQSASDKSSSDDNDQSDKSAKSGSTAKPKNSENIFQSEQWKQIEDSMNTEFSDAFQASCSGKKTCRSELLPSILTIPAPSEAALPFNRNISRRLAPSVRRSLSSLLEGQAFCRTFHKDTGVRINNRLLAGCVAGQQKIFRHATKGVSQSADIALMIDSSGSMSGSPLIQVKEAALSFLLAMENLPGVTCSAYNFPAAVPGLSDNHCMTEKHRHLGLMKSPDESVNFAVSANRFEFVAYGSTPLGDCLLPLISQMLKGKGDKKIIFALTDGQPDDNDIAKSAIDFAEKNGILFFMLMYGAYPGFEPYYCKRFINIDKYQDLPLKLSQITRNIFSR